jgi:hypothetical protein
MSRWFRLDDDVINDPKILLLPEAMRWIWIAFLCVASKNDGALPAIEIIALSLRVKASKATEYLNKLIHAGLIDQTETGYAPHNWNARQFKSDVSTTRVKRFRERERNVSETPPHTETHTQTERPSLRSGARGTRLPPDWRPIAEDRQEALAKLGSTQAIEQEMLKFHDYWKAQPGQRGVKLDWDATWRNWIRNAKGQQNAHGNSAVRANTAAGPAPTRDTAVLAGMGRALERRRAARAADDPGRQDVREAGRAGAAEGADADGGAAPGDDEPPAQLALLPAGYARA